MSSHIISQDIIDGFELLGLPIKEKCYNEDPEDVIFAHTKHFKKCTKFVSDKMVNMEYSSVAEALHAELGRDS